jgi:hypothetical protein
MTVNGGRQEMTGDLISTNVCQTMASTTLCAQCDSDGFLELPINDFDCPTFDCQPLTQYRLFANQETQLKECRMQKFKEASSRCSAVGVCHSTPEQFCKMQQEQKVREFDPRGCLDIEGCIGSESPRDVIRVGQVCEETGICTEEGLCENGQGPLNPNNPMTGGMTGGITGGIAGGIAGGMNNMGGMTMQDPCDQGFNWQYNSTNQKCGDVMNGNQCEFFIVKEMNPWTSDKVSCSDLCTSRGGRCVSGYQNDGDQCGRGDSHSCSDSFNSSVCLCSLP